MGAWTREEEVVLVYYVTRNLTYASIIEIMAVSCRSGVRKVKNISDKVGRLRKNGVLERQSPHFCLRNRDQHWNIERADRWILRSMNKAELDTLLDSSGSVAAIIGQTNDLGRFLDIMHMDDGGETYMPSRFNLYYEYQPLYHFDRLYQPENTGGVDMGNQGIDGGGQVIWPSHFNQRYELPKLSPLRSLHHLDNLYQRQFNQHYELPKLSPMLSPYHLGHVDHLGHVEQLDYLDQ